MLIKTFLFNIYVFFSNEYGFGYNEENDFSQRINEKGYSIVSANYAYVFHHGSASFGSKPINHKINEKVLFEKYSYYPSIINKFLKESINLKKERFILLNNGDNILIDLSGLPDYYNGTSEFCLNLSYYLCNYHLSGIHTTIFIERKSYAFHVNKLKIKCSK